MIFVVLYGSILGPLLFNIYQRFIFFIIVEFDVRNFADDTTLYAYDQNLDLLLKRLENDSITAIEWFENNYIELSSDKCHFLLSGLKFQQHWISLRGFKIWESNCEKLLGVHID